MLGGELDTQLSAEFVPLVQRRLREGLAPQPYGYLVHVDKTGVGGGIAGKTGV